VESWAWTGRVPVPIPPKVELRYPPVWSIRQPLSAIDGVPESHR
jgi:hypothetical protein